MSLKEPGRSKLSQLVPDHVFRHEDRNKFLPVMNRERMSDHIGNDRRSSRPGLENLLGLLALHLDHLLHEVIVDEGALFD